MAFLRKLLYYYNSRNTIKYGAYALLFLYVFVLIQIWSNRHNIAYNMIYYSGAKLSNSEPKYILVWDNSYLMLNDKKEQIFPSLQCRINNCIFTEDRDLLDGDKRRFDALLFSEIFLLSAKTHLPEKRSNSQIYIFATIESSYNCPACEPNIDNFFNWTLSHRLDSELVWPYFVVRNVARHIVAPSKHVEWQVYDNRSIPSVIRNLFHNRTKAAAWLVTHCDADSSRDDYLTRLQEHLYHFSLQIDVFGGCSQVKCKNDDCEGSFRKEYYFYMAFENSFSEDYITEKVLHGYDNYVVPIVYGGANYTRFLPPGSYINARKLHPYTLAFTMQQAIKNPEKYYEFFKWTNYYTIDSINDLLGFHPLCNLCEALNSNRKRRQQTYKQFRLWWNGRKGMQWCLPMEFWNETSRVSVDRRHIIEMYDV